MYLLGKKFEIETDHKPLVPLLSSKPLDNLPPRVLRFRLRMMRYNYSISHVPGKLLYTADALSRAPASGNHEDCLQNETEAFVAAMVSNLPATSDRLAEFWKAQAADQTLSKVINFCQTKWPDELAVQSTSIWQSLQNETEAFVAAMVSNLPATSDRLAEFWKAQAADQTLSKVINFCQTKWPDELAVSAALKPYWKIRDDFSVCKQLLLRGDRIVFTRRYPTASSSGSPRYSEM